MKVVSRFYVLLILIIIMAFVNWNFYFASSEEEITKVPINVSDEPYQNILSDSQIIMMDRYEIIPLAEYKITARVLSKKHYADDIKISPIDFALGWGDMGDLSYSENVQISQSGRWYFYRYFNSDVDRDNIRLHSSNHHIIPANKNITRTIYSVKEGEIVSLNGYLVEVKLNGNRVIKSSLSRDDQSSGACEVFYVESAERLGK